MATKRMLIDASHPEETRVVVVNGNRLEDFDVEVESRKQLKGNIYLAKVTRVEPSLQAAFVEYGGNRHGFLAFNEIHPDYYQIPVADKEALLEAEAAAERAMAAKEKEDDDSSAKAESALKAAQSEVLASDDAPEPEPKPGAETADDGEQAAQSREDRPSESAAADAESESTDTAAAEEQTQDQIQDPFGAEAEGAETAAADAAAEENENGGGAENGDDEEEDSIAEARRLRRRKLRNYKIQEVIKRRQIILVQVVKEERGNKGAALTTYLSLAGRYCVLMPNTARGGGVSRKISSATDRRRLRKIIDSLDVPEGMGLIIRTAGAKRTKAEIKRDYEYLLRLWENVRSLTLESMAPSLVYEEGSLIKRSIRDLYNKDIDTVLVEGDEAYREAKDFMRMLMPSHARNVKRYSEDISIFQKYQIEPQLDAMFGPQVQLKSGGYLVINPTEALVSIDVNSGRATRERNIENTALQTNLEAAAEVARQCRLRDLAGLIVIDFIDMEESRNNRAVEKRLKESLKQDRARVQVGRISSFGLLEMSRQRMRSGVLEGSTRTCTTCHGTGVIRSTESTALRILRAIEDQAVRSTDHDLVVRVPMETAFYLLNNKRAQILQLEAQGNIRVTVEGAAELAGAQYELVKTAGQKADGDKADKAIRLETPYDNGAAMPAEQGDESSGNGKGKRRRRRAGRNKEERQAAAAETTDSAATDTAAAAESPAGGADETETTPQKEGRPKRRRGRRGGRRNRARRSTENTAAETDPSSAPDGASDDAPAEAMAASEGHEAEPAPPPASPAEEDHARPDTPAAPPPVDSEIPAPLEMPPSLPSPDEGPLPPRSLQPETEQESPEPDTQGNGEERGNAFAAPEPAVPAAAPLPDQAAPASGALEQESPEPGETAEAHAEPEPVKPADKPKRGGWWQRRGASS